MRDDVQAAGIIAVVAMFCLGVIGIGAWAIDREHKQAASCADGTYAVTTIEGSKEHYVCVVGYLPRGQR